MAGVRKHISAATEAALWVLSTGRCYAPGCGSQVVVEVRPGVLRKNAQIAHIRGVRRPRYDPTLTAEECAGRHHGPRFGSGDSGARPLTRSPCEA